MTVTGPPASIWLRNLRTTEPELSSTLPKRTIVKTVRPAPLAARACSTISARRLLAPMMLVGRTALSVDTSTNRSTPPFSAASARTAVPKVLLRRPATALCSTIGTCL